MRASWFFVVMLFVWCPMIGSVSGQVIDEDFEDETLGQFPACPWQDAVTLQQLFNPAPDPSVTVELTTDASGDPTQALSLVDAIADDQGIFQPIHISAEYFVSADVRVDRFSDNSLGPASDWVMEIGVGHIVEGTSLCCVPQIGPYISSMTQGWRLFVAGAAGTNDDIDLEAPVLLDTWYHVEVSLTSATGQMHTVIKKIADDEVVVDRVDAVDGWTVEDARFDSAVFFDGEGSPDVTISNLAVIDNIVVQVVPFSNADVDRDGDVDLVDYSILQNEMTGPLGP